MPHLLDHHDIRSRARAAFIGLAVGDALGAPVEFMTAGEIRSKYGVLREIVGGGWLRLKPGQVTDDTEMSLCVARAIVAAGGWSLRGIAEEFAGWLRTKPVDVGDTCRRGIRNFMLKGSLETPFNQWDAGNGAAMRMLPAALYTLGDDDLLQRCALEQARITHNHPLSDAACITLGRIVHLALRGASKNRLHREADLLVADLPAFTFTPYRGLATGYVADTVQTVFHHFFRGRSFEECLVGTVNQGGDADTTGAICGMVAGAFYGMEGIPQRWLKKMDRKTMAEIAELSTRLIALSTPLRE
ncbi:ADP-ribosyl-(dinitrogen reductase) hydrolase [Geobacter metallireducens RCH3]|uniref:ADP-ribosyl-(Nitrogenase)-activating glycohydrolase n=1 Tax=Geobacter metallireducens (strain ATCC 53774 / DSM 7210 / GS-15) TaxID=269799 RepID=Q39XV2_GEOMG|nr:ADP-ribosyl-[dinitrogen reductase] hydrolase [Geobacter metallireducens]ABB30922.1 ADP-ribosyl-(nitrogenase)-activating glycohydrolase [Geobacter metallireducens GS-15]EHP85085.1 ADP-ribosyl-(dinitrogen reductase) hydrolase [Geobacter metallireducens RCH3]